MTILLSILDVVHVQAEMYDPLPCQYHLNITNKIRYEADAAGAGFSS